MRFKPKKDAPLPNDGLLVASAQHIEFNQVRFGPFVSINSRANFVEKLLLDRMLLR